MRVSDLQLLADYYYWANGRILKAAAALSDEQFVAPHPTGGHSLQHILVHTLDAECGWRQGWTGGGDIELTAEQFPTVASLSERWAAEEKITRAYLASLTDEDLDSDYEGFALWTTIVHVFNHGTQHRSEAAILLTDYGHSPDDLDLTYSIRLRQRGEA